MMGLVEHLAQWVDEVEDLTLLLGWIVFLTIGVVLFLQLLVLVFLGPDTPMRKAVVAKTVAFNIVIWTRVAIIVIGLGNIHPLIILVSNVAVLILVIYFGLTLLRQWVIEPVGALVGKFNQYRRGEQR